MFNPDGVLYGRLPGYGLSSLGHRMAAAAADDLAARERPVTALICSPLQRTRESAAPIGQAFDLEPRVDERLIEPRNRFEGGVVSREMRKPRNWPFLVNPWRPSWGEPYASIHRRMRAAVVAAFEAAEGGDVVLVSHQLPIWALHLGLAGERYMHDPRTRRCALSSITTFERRDDDVVEVGYAEPARDLLASSTDVGAV